MKSNSFEPMCALDPLLLIPRIEYAEDIYDYVRTQARDFCLVILDMKNFHVINDIYGYDTGDVVIRTFIHDLRQQLPRGSVSLRFRHGDEFLFFLPVAPGAARSLFDSFQKICESRPTSAATGDPDIFVSYRFGVIELSRDDHEDVKGLLRRAELALRQVKGQASPRLQ
jgi:diguanylate cyclase (GGDEF)-like protein